MLKKEILAIMAVIGITVTTTVQAAAVSYLDANGVTQSVDAALMAGNTSSISNWYYVQGNLNISKTVTVSGTANLILTNGSNLTISGDGSGAGLQVSQGSTLNIYAQSNDENLMGSLNATGASPLLSLLVTVGGAGAGIGGAQGAASGIITINGGKITAMGGGSGLLSIAANQGAAGIGGGNGGNSGAITINGGVVNAVGGSGGLINLLSSSGAAGIGGGLNGSGNVTINGGKVTAVGGGDSELLGVLTSGGLLNVGSNSGLLGLLSSTGASGIGGGYGGNGNVKIFGGTVEALGGSSAIGKGLNSSGTPNVQITGVYDYLYNTNATPTAATSGKGLFSYSSTYKYIKLQKTTIAGSGSVSMTNWTYGSTANSPVASSTTNGTGNVTYRYKVKDASDATYTSTFPTNAGLYTIRATFAGTNDYLEYSATADFEIIKKTLAISNVSATARAYNGTSAVQLSGGVLSGILTGDNVSIVLDSGGTMADKNDGIIVLCGSIRTAREWA